jgi:hypothetical protein
MEQQVEEQKDVHHRLLKVGTTVQQMELQRLLMLMIQIIQVCLIEQLHLRLILLDYLLVSFNLKVELELN